MAKHTNKDSSGTSFHSTTIITNVGKLIKLFPDSYTGDNKGNDKVNFDFCLETSKGDVFTIYDWKYYRPIGMYEPVTFNIGGFSREVTETAKRELLEIL